MARPKVLPCSFTGVSIGKDTALISVSVPSEKLSQDAEGQQTIEGCSREKKLEIEAESQGFHTYSDRYTASLKVSKADTDIRALAEFANRRGKIKAKRTGNAKPGEDGDDDERSN